MSIQIIATDDEIFLTEKEMKPLTISKAEAARWIGVSSKTIDNWERTKKIRIEDGRAPVAEAVRLMKKHAA